jgi:hypothetical protein
VLFMNLSVATLPSVELYDDSFIGKCLRTSGGG